MVRDRSLGKQKREVSFDQSSKINLEGDFKDKMVTFIKILEMEKKVRPETGFSQYNESRREGQCGLVEEITQNVTSKLRNKTNYQMLGELLRNNSHIAKQVGKYIKNMNPFE